MNAIPTETQSKVDANCNMIRQLRWLQREYWQSFEFDIQKLVEANEDLLKREAKDREIVKNAV